MESGVVGIVSHIVSSAAAGTRSGRQSRRSATWTILALCFCLYVASPCHGAVSADIVQGVKDATEHLGSKFDDIRAQVLGADLLAAEYERVGFDYSPLDISKFLSNDHAAQHIDAVLEAIGNITAGSSSDSGLPSDCCEGSSRSEEVCCHGCIPASNQGLLSAVTDSLAHLAALENIRAELEFGHINSTLLRYPTSQPASDCTTLDSNLQPWFMRLVRRRPLEIVLLLDLNNNRQDPSVTQGLRMAATQVLNSLTQEDKVQIVVVAEKVQQYMDESGSNKVLPVCALYRKELRRFIETALPERNPMGPADYLNAFVAAFNKFNTDSTSDKLILFFSSLSNLYAASDNFNFFDEVIDDVSVLNAARNHSVVVSAYYNNNDPLTRIPGNEFRLTQLVRQRTRGIARDLADENGVRDYYSVFNAVNSTADIMPYHVGRDVNSRGDASLSLTMALTEGDDVIGAFHALLPWNMLFPLMDDHFLGGRGNSHFFIMNEGGYILHHPLVPGDFQSPVSVATIESPDILDRVNGLTSPAEFAVSAERPSLTPVSVRNEDGNAFVSGSVGVRYTCRPLDTRRPVVLYACVGVAEEDKVTTDLKDVDITSVYGDDPERLPLYHSSEVPEDNQCFYFCSVSTTDRLSVQLIGPSSPPPDVELSTINDILSGDPARHHWVEEGVANELGVVSIVGRAWRNVSSDSVVDYVVRRHLATPSGLYLTFPFAHLSPDFDALLAEWFVFSSAHPHSLTLTPPRLDPLWERGHVVSAGVTLSTPPQDKDGSRGGLLSVIAADITLPALQLLLEDATSLCTDSDNECFLLDDQGNILYHNILLTREFKAKLEKPAFLISPPETTPDTTQIEEFREILINLLSDGIASKVRCIDYLNETVRQRLFFSFNLSDTEVHAVSSNGIEFAIQNIPGTNVFFGIYRQTNESLERICLCTRMCQTCDRNEGNGCECPCQCPEDCTTPHSFPACPVPTMGRDLLAQVTSTSSPDRKPQDCFSSDCSSKTETMECTASRDCHWCSQNDMCLHISECCAGVHPGPLPSCVDLYVPEECKKNDTNNGMNNGPDNNETNGGGGGRDDGRRSDSSSDTTASVVGGVLGALLVLIIIGVLAGFFAWQKVCRKGLYDDEQKENAFDFSKSRVTAKNPIDEDTKDVEANNSENHYSSQPVPNEKTGNETTF